MNPTNRFRWLQVSKSSFRHLSKMRDYPNVICFPCGKALGNWTPVQYEGRVCTAYPGTCGVCGEETTVTEPRDFGHLRKGWERIADSMAQGK